MPRCSTILKAIKKSAFTNMKDIYVLLGVSWQTVYKWSYDSTTTQSRGGLKHDFIVKAGELFSLTPDEKEKLANKAGLSLHCIGAKIGNQKKGGFNIDFADCFKKLLATYSGKNFELYEAALVSERMFRHIKSGRYLKKEPILALLVVLGLGLNDIQATLKKAGFFLSNSIPADVVIKWLLINEARSQAGAMRLRSINDALYSLELPLLMTREYTSR